MLGMKPAMHRFSLAMSFKPSASIIHPQARSTLRHNPPSGTFAKGICLTCGAASGVMGAVVPPQAGPQAPAAGAHLLPGCGRQATACQHAVCTCSSRGEESTKRQGHTECDRGTVRVVDGHAPRLASALAMAAIDLRLPMVCCCGSCNLSHVQCIPLVNMAWLS
jgi:hypothetical protein